MPNGTSFRLTRDGIRLTNDHYLKDGAKLE